MTTNAKALMEAQQFLLETRKKLFHLKRSI